MMYKDQVGREVIIQSAPARIVSLVPSQTELLFDLGLANSIAGVTSYCIHPTLAQAKTIVGGTKKLDIDKIISLQPDLIIANKEENNREDIEHLAQRFPVWVSDINNLTDALLMICQIGEVTHTSQTALNMIAKIEQSFAALTARCHKKVAYLIWRKPYMAAGTGTFINDMLLNCGLVNAIEDVRYPKVSIEDLKKAQVEIILLSSEPYPFSQKHVAELKVHLPQTLIKLVDGELFSWYGSRLSQSAQYFRQLIDDLNNTSLNS